MKVRVSNIQRFSLHDGPGIRTTVFLKGCNLRCPWCSNPENIDFEPTKYINENTKEQGIFGKDIEMSELFEEIMKDKQYYNMNDGGVTFSGGEPLLQIKVIEPLLKLREEMNDARAMIYNTSEYKLMAKHFETIEKITKEIRDKNLDLDNISDEMTDNLFNAYVGLAETTTNYMLIKSVVPSTTRGEKRLAFAKNLQKFADNTLEKLGVTFRKEEETIQEEKMHVKETEEMELGIDM